MANPKNTWFLTTPDRKWISDPTGRAQGAYAAGTVQVMELSEIIESIPAGGGKVDAGGTVKLVVSKGPERYAVPMTTGLTPEAAQAALKKYPLLVGTVSEVFNSDIPKGFVISTSPSSGASVKRDTTVNLLVSKGIEQIALASYLGKSGEQALNELTDAGFDVKQSDEFSDKYPAGIVIAQNPTDPELTKGAKVTLTISKGPEKIKVPSGVLKSEETKAIKLLEDYGFTVKVLKPAKVAKGKKLTVVKVSPAEGVLVKPNSVITIEVK
mgnify:CR=1 FL=1